MKIIDLLNCLSSIELEEIRSSLKAHPRKSLIKLFDGLQNQHSGSRLDKPALYQSVYGKTYSESKDYLIRNEIRLLSQHIEQFIVKESIEAEIRETPSFGVLYRLRRYENYGSWNLYEKEWRKQFKLNENNKVWGTMADLLYEKARYLRKHKELSVALFEEIHELTNDAIRYESRHAQEKIRRAELENALANRYLQAYIPEHEMPEVSYGLFFKPSRELCSVLSFKFSFEFSNARGDIEY